MRRWTTRFAAHPAVRGEEVEGLEDEGEELKRQQAILEKEKVCIVEYVVSAQGRGPLMRCIKRGWVLNAYC